MHTKAWFTLVELLISLVIIGILSILIVRVYQTMTSIWVRVEHEKMMQNELLFAMQTVQNLVDNNVVIVWSGGSTNQTIVLSGSQGFISMSLVWNGCSDPLPSSGKTESDCNLHLTTAGGQTIRLFNTEKIALHNTAFRPIPDKAFTLQDESRDEIATQYKHPWFRRFGTVTIRRYNTKSRAFKTSLPFQTFFNSRL